MDNSSSNSQSPAAICRRSREEVAVSILKSCAYQELTVSRLMMTANLSHKLLQRHLPQLISAKLVEIDEKTGRKLISTTDHGLVALRCYRNAMALLNGHTGSCLSLSTRSPFEKTQVQTFDPLAVVKRSREK